LADSEYWAALSVAVGCEGKPVKDDQKKMIKRGQQGEMRETKTQKIILCIMGKKPRFERRYESRSELHILICD
jgi:hypothetical protein